MFIGEKTEFILFLGNIRLILIRIQYNAMEIIDSKENRFSENGIIIRPENRARIFLRIFYSMLGCISN